MQVVWGLGVVLARIAPEAVAVTIVTTVFKLITHSIDDPGRWRRLMIVVVPLLVLIFVVVLALVAVGVWWMVGDGGVDVLLHFAQT